MSEKDWDDEEFDDIRADHDWCYDCDTPIGVGPCDGCLAVAVSVDPEWPVARRMWPIEGSAGEVLGFEDDS